MMVRLAAAWCWLLPLVLAAAVVTAMDRHHRRRDRGRALHGAGAAAVVTAAVWGLVRLGDWLMGMGGPLAWVGVPAGGRGDLLMDSLGALRLSLTAGGVFAASLVVVRLWREEVQPGSPSPPFARLAAILAALAGLLVLCVRTAFPVELAPFLDLAAVGPVIALGLVLYLMAPRVAPASPPAPGRIPSTDPVSSGAIPVQLQSPEQVLRRHGRLQGKEPDFETRPARPQDRARDDLQQRVWTTCGGMGAAPKGLVRALAAVIDHRGASRFATDRADAGLLIGDLSAETEDALVTALSVLVLLAHAGRALVVCADPDARCAEILRALGELGLPRPGPCVARVGQLRDALARGEVPVLVCLGLGELSGSAIQALGDPAFPWLAMADMVLLCRVDRLLPIEATHLAFTLSRLALALDALRGAPTWVAVGEGTLGARRFLEQAVGRTFEQVPLGAGTAAQVRVFARLVPRGTDDASELLSFGRILAAEHIVVDVEDATAVLGAAAQEVTGSKERVTQRPGYHGGCALSLLEDRHLASLFRARGNVAHRVPGNAHLGCWWVRDSPLARFLLQKGTLAGLEQQDELPSPSPVAGLRNPYLAAAHLEAALHEGRPDEIALRRVFGDEPVAELRAARQDVHTEGMRARFEPHSRTIVRALVLTRGGTPWPDGRRETVTQSVVEVRSKHEGALLRRVDRRLVQTRFYPHRVFQARGQLYQVGDSALPPSASHVAVAPAPAGAVPTDPLLQIEPAHQRWLSGMERHSAGHITFGQALSVVSVQESVTGVIPRGSDEATVSYAPARAQYDSVVAVIVFERARSSEALYHAARVVDLLLPAHLQAEPEDIEVMAFYDGFGGLARPAMVFVDRSVGGIGIAEALDAHTVRNLLRWAWGVLYTCPCMEGCAACTPKEVLRAGRDKQGALKLLGG